MKSFYETDADKTDYIKFDLLSETSIYPHFHKSIEFVYCVDGILSTIINGEKISLYKDEMYALPSLYIHAHKQLKGNKIYAFVFSQNYFDDFKKSFPEKTFDIILNNKEKNREIFTVLENIHDLFNQYNFDYNKIPYLERQAVINHFLYTLTRIYPLRDFSHEKTDDYFLEILQYINSHYTENLSLTSLANHFNYNKKYFSDLFNKKTGFNLKSYINNLRVENAIAQMENQKNKKTITEIAFDCGFNSIASFYRALKNFKNQ